MRLFTNTQYFREAALDYEKNRGRYTLAPIGTKEWNEYWVEQERRCLYGYKVGDMKITGRHYFYLNFCRIQRTIGKGKVERKIEMFPGFWEIDYNWFWYKEIAWWGCTPEFLAKLKLWRDPTYLGGARHLSCLKTRRAGFSYKEASDGVYNYNFVPKSKSFFLADKEPYLIDDGILNKVEVNLNWLNTQTDGFWLKNRMRSGTILHQKASYIDNIDKQEKGFFSEIIGVVISGDPDKARGKDGLKVTFEEAGSFTNLKAALDIVVPSVRAGSSITGQISVFGTGGEEGQDIEGLDEIFNDPYTYDMLSFQNDWEEGYESTECGVFIPCYMANPTYMDDHGNVDIEAAKADDNAERVKAKGARDPKKIDRRMAEFPQTPTEALIRVNANNFPINEAKYQKNRILRSDAIKGTIKYGNFVRTGDQGLVFMPQSRSEAKPLDFYPHKKDNDLTGCVTIVNDPVKDASNKVPADTYIINVDPYYDEEAIDTTSLGACYVTKRKNTLTGPSDPYKFAHDVAWYVARPKSLNKWYENLFMLAEYYNAKIQSEIAGGGKGIYDYARLKNKLHMLEFTPININNQEIKKVKSNRTYFMTMSTDDKRVGLTYYQDSLSNVVGLDEDGNELLEIHFIWDLALLDEIIKFSPSKNCDRISAQILKQFMIREKDEIEGKKKKKPRKRIYDSVPKVNGGGNTKGLIAIKDGEVVIN